MTRWLLVRHGETEWNRTDRAQGHADVPLSETGRQQAAALANVLAAVPLDAVYSSDLSRALQTAELLLHGRDGLKPVVTSELRELSYGRWEGFTFADAQKDNPDLFARMLNRDATFVAPGGEGVTQLVARVKTFTDRVQAERQDGTLLVVAHGGSLRAILLTLLQLPVERFRQFTLAPASLSIVEVHPPGSSLVLWNDTSHYRRVP